MMATVDAQFMVFSILGDAKPASGWPAGAVGAMGTITPIKSGYYNQKLVRVWTVAHRVAADSP